MVGRAIVLLGLVGVLRCTSAPSIPAQAGEDTVAWARGALAAGHYRAVVRELERLVLNYPDRPFSDEAQYLLGEAHMGLEEYILAEDAFRMVLDAYPASPWRDDAELGIARALARRVKNRRLDQSSTVSAERALQRFLEDHPSSPLVPEARRELREVQERLAQKLLDSARFYFRRGKTVSARIYLSQVIERYPSSRGALEARFLRGQAAEREGDLGSAANEYQALLDDLPPGDGLRERVMDRLRMLRRKAEGAGTTR